MKTILILMSGYVGSKVDIESYALTNFRPAFSAISVNSCCVYNLNLSGNSISNIKFLLSFL
ncbi:MAG: hypothetical protein ABIL66_03050 [candidate division WOR-3 bacterium]